MRKAAAQRATPDIADIDTVDSIVTIAENRKYEIGIACLRMSDFSVELSSICDDQAYSKCLSVLGRHDPRQLLFPPASADTLLERIAEAEFPLCRIGHVPRKTWNEMNGLGYVRHYAHPAHLAALETDVSSKFLCLSALAALIDAVEAAERTPFVKGALAIKFAPVDGVMLLGTPPPSLVVSLPNPPLLTLASVSLPPDPSTIANLELLRNLRTGDPKSSLYGALNHCLTAAGSRCLRASIIQPSKDLVTISARLDGVTELLEREGALHDLRKVLPAFAESDRGTATAARSNPCRPLLRFLLPRLMPYVTCHACDPTCPQCSSILCRKRRPAAAREPRWRSPPCCSSRLCFAPRRSSPPP